MKKAPIDADDFIGPAAQAGFDFYCGVPCSFLTPLINRVIGHPTLDYVGAASEGEAVAIAAGAWLAGRDTVVMCQNSGLGNMVNPLTSLNHPFRIPTLMIVTWRAGPGLKDEPQHEIMGQITPDLIKLMGITHRPFPTGDISATLDKAVASIDKTGLPYALIMEKGMVADGGLDAAPPDKMPPGTLSDLQATGSQLVRRADCLETTLDTLPADAAIIATTGKCGRELFTICDRPQHLYQVGSMGGASGMALGVALNSKRPVVVLDGDGAALMKMGSLATIGAYRPDNLIHIILDNGVHDSTGGQPTVSSVVDFAAIAQACGYRNAFSCNDIEGYSEAIRQSLANAGPTMIHMRIAPGSMDKLGRPTVRPVDVARRFKGFLTGF